MSCQNHHGEGEGGLAGAKEHKKYSNMTTYLHIIQIFDFFFPSSGNFNKFSPKLKDENSTLFAQALTRAQIHKVSEALSHFQRRRTFTSPWTTFFLVWSLKKRKYFYYEQRLKTSQIKRTGKRQTEGIKHVMYISENNSDVEH